MKEYKMIILDLDGTVLNGESKLEKETKQALQEVMKRGKKVVLSSSRSYEEMRCIIEELYEDCRGQFSIGFGGACVYRQDGSVLAVQDVLEGEEADFLIGEASKRNIHIHGYDEVNLYYYKDTEELRTFLAFADVEHIPMEALTYEQFRKKKFLKLMCLGDMDKLEAYRREAVSVANTAFSNPIGQQGYLDLCGTKASKGTGAALLCERVGILKEECICVGDGENDIPMLRFGGFGIAMKNGGDSVKEAADYVSPFTNQENAIPYLVKKFLL